MNVRALKRDPGLAKTAFKTTENGTLVAREKCAIMIPQRFVERSMAVVGSDNSTIGLCAWIVGQSYFVTLTPAYFHITPTSIEEVKVDGDVYVLFHFDKNTIVMPNINLVKDSRVIGQIFEEILYKARVPWYMNYVDRSRVYRSASTYAGTGIGSQLEVVELITATNTRSLKDRDQYFRHVVKKTEDLFSHDDYPTGLETVEYSASSTLTKLTGAYQDRGIVSALNTPSERTEDIERYLRM